MFPSRLFFVARQFTYLQTENLLIILLYYAYRS